MKILSKKCIENMKYMEYFLFYFINIEITK